MGLEFLFLLLVIVVVAIAIAATARPARPAFDLQFTASPRHRCGPGPVTLTWRTTGDSLTLSADRAVTGSLGRVTNTDSPRTVTVNRTTNFTAEATRAGESPRRQLQQVEIFDSSGALITIGDISVRAQCREYLGLIRWVVSYTFPASEWDSSVGVGVVSLPLGATRTILVEHDGIVREVGPGLPADFGGVSIQGVWTLSTPLSTTETCGSLGTIQPGTPSSEPPFLSLVAEVVCH